MSARAWQARRSGLRGRCRSNRHRRRTLAVAIGTFSLPWNREHVEHGVQYCRNCVDLLTLAGMFEADS